MGMDTKRSERNVYIDSINPSPQQILRRCAEIQVGWSERERAKRRLIAWGITAIEKQDELLKWFEFKPDPVQNDDGHFVI